MEDRPQINLYIETSIRGPRIQDGEYIYVLECFVSGKPETRDGSGIVTEATENKLTLMALLEALSRITKPASIRIFTRCGHALNSLQNHWPRQWQAAGWLNARGKPVKNAELWDLILEKLDPHVYTVTDEDHIYRKRMLTELKFLEGMKEC